MNSSQQGAALTLRIAGTSVFIFASYFIIGLQMAVVPAFVHWRLGFNPVIAGLAISIQYAATLLSRPVAGHLSDRRGGKFATCFGLFICAASGAVFLFAATLAARPLLSLVTLLASRLLLGYGEGCSATGATLWGIGRTGPEHTARVISWSGVASCGAVAIGAPSGVWLEKLLGAPAVGAAGVAVITLALFWSLAIERVPAVQGEGAGYHRVFTRVFPYGLGLAMAGIGFGTISSFITLYYASRHWGQSAYALSAFGIAFVTTRLIFARIIDKRGGYRVAMVSLAVETLGLLLLWSAPMPGLALAGCAISGAGFSLVFPALGVEAVQRFHVNNRGAALGFYTAFVDLALGVAGPMAGFIVVHSGYSTIFPVAAAFSFCTLILTAVLYRAEGLRRCETGGFAMREETEPAQFSR